MQIEDDGKTTDTLVIAKGLYSKAKKGEKPRTWDECYAEAFTEATRRAKAIAEIQIGDLNANAEALAVLEAGREVGPVDMRLAEANARVEFTRAGYPNAEAVILAKAKMAEQQKERAKSIAAVARRILARSTGAVQASGGAAIAPEKSTTAKAVVTPAPPLGTFARVDNAKAKPKAKVEHFIPAGMSIFQAADAAMRNQLPIRTIASRGAVRTMAEVIQANARAAGDECSWEEATALAFTRIETAKKTGAL